MVKYFLKGAHVQASWNIFMDCINAKRDAPNIVNLKFHLDQVGRTLSWTLAREGIPLLCSSLLRSRCPWRRSSCGSQSPWARPCTSGGGWLTWWPGRKRRSVEPFKDFGLCLINFLSIFNYNSTNTKLKYVHWTYEIRVGIRVFYMDPLNQQK